MTSKLCKFCKDTPEDGTGNAPPRQKSRVKTCYDHLELFHNFKKSKELEKLIQKKKCELVAQNENFTNFKIDSDQIDDFFKHFNSQEIGDFKEKLNRGLLNIVNVRNSLNKVNLNENEIARREKLKNMSRCPIVCPVTSCCQTIGVTSVLSHFLRDHQTPLHPVSFQEISCNRRSVLEFSKKFFEFDEVICLGVLVYAGHGENKGDRPAQLGLCKVNSFLPDKYQNLIHHLPIVIMGVKTCISALLDNPVLAKEFSDPDDKEKHIYVIWLSTVETTRKMHCTITVYDREGKSSRSTIIPVRNLKDSQYPHEFLPLTGNCLILNNGEMKILSQDNTANIFAEIYIHEYLK